MNFLLKSTSSVKETMSQTSIEIEELETDPPNVNFGFNHEQEFL